MPQTRFFILTSTRSGSTWLLTLLNGQEAIRAFGEIFLWREVRPEFAWVAEGDPERFYVRREALGRTRLAQMPRYLREVEGRMPLEGAGGFKLIVSHLRQVPELPLALLWRRYRMILLVRDNVFESTVSEILSTARNNPHGEAPSGAHPLITIDPRVIVARIRTRSRAIRAMRLVQRLWPWPSVVVDYDDLVRDQRASLAPVLRALGSAHPPQEVESRLTRRVTRPYREMITNTEEIFAAMRQAGLGRYCPPDP